MSILDIATQAGCAAQDGTCDLTTCPHASLDCRYGRLVNAALRTAYPREPSAETLRAVALELADEDDEGWNAFHPMNRASWEKRARAMYRSLPLWQALWGEEPK